jgi:hypothetical protein
VVVVIVVVVVVVVVIVVIVVVVKEVCCYMMVEVVRGKSTNNQSIDYYTVAISMIPNKVSMNMDRLYCLVQILYKVYELKTINQQTLPIQQVSSILGWCGILRYMNSPSR